MGEKQGTTPRNHSLGNPALWGELWSRSPETGVPDPGVPDPATFLQWK